MKPVETTTVLYCWGTANRAGFINSVEEWVKENLNI